MSTTGAGFWCRKRRAAPTHLVGKQRQLQGGCHVTRELPQVAAAGGSGHEGSTIQASQHRQQQRLVQLQMEGKGQGGCKGNEAATNDRRSKRLSTESSRGWSSCRKK